MAHTPSPTEEEDEEEDFFSGMFQTSRAVDGNRAEVLRRGVLWMNGPGEGRAGPLSPNPIILVLLILEERLRGYNWPSQSSRAQLP